MGSLYIRFVIVLILLSAGLGFSCRQETKEISPELSFVDSIIWDYPDSALTVLGKMPKPASYDQLNNATWCLLYTEAWDKNHKRHTSDSLINIAFRYFDARVDGRRKAQAWFYKGAVLRDLSKLEDAAACYVRARDLIGSFDDPLFASLICQTLGRIYREEKLYDKAFDLFRDAVYYVSQVPRRDDRSHAYSELGRTFVECKELDSARYYFECSLKNGLLIDDLKTQAMAVGELGVVYRNEGNYEKALEYQKKNLALKWQLRDSINFSAVKFGIATVFYQMGKLDSAEVYLKESLNASTLGRTRTANLLLYFIARKQMRYDDAFNYIEEYRHYNDSLNNIERTRSIAELEAKYDNEKLENDKKTLLLEKDQLQKSILWGGIVMILFIGLIAFGYQRKLWLKERSLRKSEEDIQQYLSSQHVNKEMIHEKEALIRSLSNDLEIKKSLIDNLREDTKHLESEKKKFQQKVEEYTQSINKNQEIINDHVACISNLREHADFLKSQNQQYLQKIDDYSHLTKQNEDRVIKLEKLTNQNLPLRNREAFLLDYINKHVELFMMLRENPRSVDWIHLYESLDILHNGFCSRLKNEFPSLTEMDLQVCCLIKIGLTNSQIANILCISDSSVTKRKYRIRERMSQCKEELIISKMTLDVFLKNY